MKVCILNSQTKIVENIIIIDSIEDFIPYKNGIELAPQHDGEIGWTWNGSGWNENSEENTVEFFENRARTKRNNLLKKYVDKMNGLRWESMTEEQKDSWRTYRQALLDVPQQFNFPYDIIWPIKPE